MGRYKRCFMVIDLVLEAVNRNKDYWIKKNFEYGRGDEIFNERVWNWCLKIWDKFCEDKRYKLGFVLFRIDRGDGFYLHRDKGSGKGVLLVVLDGFIRFTCEGEKVILKKGMIHRFSGNRLHGLDKGGNGKYLVLFSRKL